MQLIELLALLGKIQPTANKQLNYFLLQCKKTKKIYAFSQAALTLISASLFLILNVVKYELIKNFAY